MLIDTGNFASHKEKNQPEINKSPTEKWHCTLMFIKIFKDKLYFFLKGGQENICVYSLTLENFRVFCLFICLFVVVLLTVSELDLTDWNHTDSGESRQ